MWSKVKRVLSHMDWTPVVVGALELAFAVLLAYWGSSVLEHYDSKPPPQASYLLGVLSYAVVHSLFRRGK